MPPFTRLRIVLLASCCMFMAAPQAQALTLGEYREAYAARHILDPMPAEQRATYIQAHRNELDLAQAKLDTATAIVRSIMWMNAVEVQAGHPPFICNYDLEGEGDDLEFDEWLDEFRKEAPVKFKLDPEKADVLIDHVDFNDVIAHKVVEKFPCPMPKARAAKTAKKTDQAVHKTAVAETADKH